MKLQSQCTSLEISKKLKSLGVKQDESIFYWCERDLGGEWDIRPAKWVFEQEIALGHDYKNTEISAFTVAELGEIFKTRVTEEILFKLPPEIAPEDDSEFLDPKVFSADFWGKALVFLIEQALIKI